MKSFLIVSKNGQITIPKKFREDFKLDEGSIVFFLKDGSKMSLMKIGVDQKVRNVR